MKYTVVWKPEAERRLATIWEDASEKRAVTAAADEIDRMLGVVPETCGESGSSGRRILLVPPLGVVFKVQPQDRTVAVLTVWSFD